MFDTIDRIVVKYISENRRIIVPQFGAFMRKESGEVVFVEFLKKTDGVLQALLRNNTTLNETQASVAIEEFVAKVKSNVEQRGSYVIEGLGSLSRDKDGIYELSYDPNIKVVELAAAPVPLAQEKKIIEEGAENTNATGNRGIIGDQTAPETIADRLARDVHYREVSTENSTKTAQNNTSSERLAVRPAERRVEDKRADAAKKRSQEGGVKQNAPKQTPRPHPQQRPARVPEQRKKRADLVMIIAIVAALLAIGAMIFGAWSDNPLTKIQPIAPVEQVEQGENVNEQGGGEAN